MDSWTFDNACTETYISYSKEHVYAFYCSFKERFSVDDYSEKNKYYVKIQILFFI